jgi:hypothetical protein
VRPEYGHMDLAHLFDHEGATVFQYAISGLRFACDQGAPTATAIRDRVYEAMGVDPAFKFDVAFFRIGTNDLKYHATSKTGVKVDAVFRSWKKMLTEIQAAFGCKVVFLGAGITNLDGNISIAANTNVSLGGPRLPTEVREFPIIHTDVGAKEKKNENRFCVEVFDPQRVMVLICLQCDFRGEPATSLIKPCSGFVTRSWPTSS